MAAFAPARLEPLGLDPHPRPDGFAVAAAHHGMAPLRRW